MAQSKPALTLTPALPAAKIFILLKLFCKPRQAAQVQVVVVQLVAQAVAVRGLKVRAVQILIQALIIQMELRPDLPTVQLRGGDFLAPLMPNRRPLPCVVLLVKVCPKVSKLSAQGIKLSPIILSTRLVKAPTTQPKPALGVVS